ncbi:hypothetical protein [Allosphingosinicella sp.]|uniref:hypothetical protein n=1 Tax=Allosphingosinicella sp. TaxID=2823234 RepID=UPI002FC0ADEC
MSRLMTGTTLALMLALASCGEGAPETDRAETAAPESATNYQQEILSLDEGQRNAVFIRAIRDADIEGTCQGVESSAYVGEYQDAPMWTARCSDGTDWAIVLGPTGTAQVMACAAAEQAGLPSCATRPTA